jgi:hypothetical protein
MLTTTTLAFLLLGALLVLGGCGVADDRASPSRTVLLTGFEPFGGRDVNESWEAVKVLEGTTLRGAARRGRATAGGVRRHGGAAGGGDREVRPEVDLVRRRDRVVRVETLARNAYNEIRPLDNLGNAAAGAGGRDRPGDGSHRAAGRALLSWRFRRGGRPGAGVGRRRRVPLQRVFLSVDAREARRPTGSARGVRARAAGGRQGRRGESSTCRRSGGG